MPLLQTRVRDGVIQLFKTNHGDIDRIVLGPEFATMPAADTAGEIFVVPDTDAVGWSRISRANNAGGGTALDVQTNFTVMAALDDASRTDPTKVIWQLGEENNTLQTNLNGGEAYYAIATIPISGPLGGMNGSFGLTRDDTTNGVVNAIEIGHTSSDDDPTIGDGVGVSFRLENDANTVEEWGSIDWVSTSITDGSEDGDLVFSTMLAGTVTEAVRLDSSDQSLTLGRDATDASGINKLRIFPLTTAKGSFVLQAADQTGDTVVTLTPAAMGQAVTFTLPDSGGDSAILAAGNGSTFADVQIHPFSWRVHDALQTNLPGTAATDDLAIITGTFGTDSYKIQTSDAKATTVTQRARTFFTLPAWYVPGETITIEALAGMNTTISDDTATLDFEVFRHTQGAGVGGTDIQATAAADINNLTAAAKSFTVTPTNLNPGDVLDIRMTIAITDAATGTAVIGEVTEVNVQIGVGN